MTDMKVRLYRYGSCLVGGGYEDELTGSYLPVNGKYEVRLSGSYLVDHGYAG
jgi:hypothetical protein